MNTYSVCNQPVLLRSIEPGQYTSWAFGQRLRHAGLLGSMGTVGDALDNAVAESFFATLQTRAPRPLPLGRHASSSQSAIFEWIECFYNPQRRHSTLGMARPVDYDMPPNGPRHDHYPHPTRPGKRGNSNNSSERNGGSERSGDVVRRPLCARPAADEIDDGAGHHSHAGQVGLERAGARLAIGVLQRGPGLLGPW